MAAYAAIVLGVPEATIIIAALVAIGATAASHPPAAAWGVGAAIVWAGGYFAGMSFRLRLPYRAPMDALARIAPKRGSAASRSALIDKRKPAWLGSWAADLADGRYRFTIRSTLIWLSFAVAAALLATASVVQDTEHPPSSAASSAVSASSCSPCAAGRCFAGAAHLVAQLSPAPCAASSACR